MHFNFVEILFTYYFQACNLLIFWSNVLQKHFNTPLLKTWNICAYAIRDYFIFWHGTSWKHKLRIALDKWGHNMTSWTWSSDFSWNFLQCLQLYQVDENHCSTSFIKKYPQCKFKIHITQNFQIPSIEVSKYFYWNLNQSCQI